VFKYIDGYGIDISGSKQKQRALELSRIDDWGCWFDGPRGRLDDLEEVISAFGTITFFVPPGFQDLLDWIRTGKVLENLEERKQALYYLKKSRY
jgi:hypothetical protein